MLRRILQPLWVLLALIFLVEAWLWDHLEPVVARVVAWIPLRRFKAWLAERVDTLSPAMTLIVAVSAQTVRPVAARERILGQRHSRHRVREIPRRRSRGFHLRRDAVEIAADGVVQKIVWLGDRAAG
jgi:hypothetical protein